MTATRIDAGSKEGVKTLGRALLVQIRRGDLLALIAAPAVMVGLFALPLGTRRDLAFHYADPTVVTAFTAHYVHLEATHLAANLIAYCLLASVGYALALVSRRRRFFLTAVATYLLAFPFALSALNLAVPRYAIGYGFSGINMALFGLLPLVLVAFARVHLFPESSVGPLPALFFLTVGWMGTLSLPIETGDPVSIGVTVASLAAGVGYLLAATRGTDYGAAARNWVRTVRVRAGYGDLFVLGALLFVTYPAVGFPADPAADGRVLNLYVHVLGFCLGFIGPYVLLTTDLVRD